jgi:hypothetical protein
VKSGFMGSLETGTSDALSEEDARWVPTPKDASTDAVLLAS